MTGLCSGVFWVIIESPEIINYKLLAFKIPCDAYGNPLGRHIIPLNAKSGGTYNHKSLWETEIKNNKAYKPYNKKPFNYYPRGRVDVKNNRAVIYLNAYINHAFILQEIQESFGLYTSSIDKVKIIVDNSTHYACFINNR